VKVILRFTFFLIIPAVTFSQSVKVSVLTGKISNHSAENVYVKFESTAGIEKGDTLFVLKKNKLKPAIRVEFISSKSVSGIELNGFNFSPDDLVYAMISIISDDKNVPVNSGVLIVTDTKNDFRKEIKKPIVNKVEPKMNGRVTMQSYSNFTNQSSKFNYQRWRYTFKLNAKNIGGSNLSYNQYINFAYRASDWNEVSSNLGKAFKVYELSLKYDFSGSTTLWIGRHLSRRISNIGPVDGLQFETGFSNFALGVIAGSRPNLGDMGINTKLFEYGAYISRYDSIGQRRMNNSLGYFEQTNNSETDRRFIYFQHSNSIVKFTRIFLSTQIDLFKKINGESKNEFSLTSIFVSANIRPSNFISFYLSYDARKNVIYYETFKNFIDSVFENETRQGFRTRITIKPVRNLFIGANYGYRFRKGDPKPSNNYGGYITYSMIPFIKSGLTFSYSRLFSTSVSGSIWGFRMYKDINLGFGLSLGYRNTKYQFTQNIDGMTEQSVSLGISTRLLNPIYVNFTYEGVFQRVTASGRVLINLSYRI
jgi:hypothetical protein